MLEALSSQCSLYIMLPQVYCKIITIFMEFTAQNGKDDREKRTSDRARTRDLRSIAESPFSF